MSDKTTMTRDDINYWMSPRFDPAPPTDEELTRGRPIGKRMHAILLADAIKTMVARGFAYESIERKVDQLARMVKDEEASDEDEQS